ncbi:coiled-coil domain-containing protein 152 [Denticeps clupeoides]|uniref:coiled-coil domain-containing protein 152 n=1 Tax=Denticeps clupeoides TaxID=299321 RepID=UPI0010A2FB72|nr:coiled-coil domain-containing protein 152 [Denticeps clupeoides]
MNKSTAVNLDKLVNDFSELEQTITQMKGDNIILEMKLEETKRLLRITQKSEKHLTEEWKGMLGTIQGLQQTVQEQLSLRAENDELKNMVTGLREEGEERAKGWQAQVRRLQAEAASLKEHHQRELVDAHREIQRKLEEKDREMKEVFKRNETAVEDLTRKVKDLEKEKQSEIVKLQMEFSAKLARAQSMMAKPQQPQGHGLLSQNIFRRKLQFMQVEKNQEIEALRQKVKELEQLQLQAFSDSRLKKRRS